ncbi:hypothetical protein HYPSUDRAFT_37761 [Hypholoma sublateritium FD-334 SS-4]|uniref:UPF3 domain-containing protein n=1 Tax=Hypholoma sublateritium (strain FD-334 SS-4) TaxID=945553 RepID=A0A0D2LD41_HYPSF|nr:hypothetical protein HYPSUDRAFT_37761 [Hypholoma sublateritium FD-334 SS-4]
MSTTAPVHTKPSKTRKEKEKEREKAERKASLPQQNERLKTVVRRLPPNLPEEIFWNSVQVWVSDDTAVWKIYCPGKLRKKLNKENIPSRAYIAFKDEDQLAAFSRGYDGHVFRDKAGVESQAVVEFAPYPKIPSEKRKADPRNGTIEKDEDYISFLETLKAAENAEPVSLETLIASAQPTPHPKTTPLLEALKAEKSANKDKEAILRNHAHYNNMSVAALRKEEKKKATAAPPPKADANGNAAAANSAQPSAKKGKKAAAAAAAAATATQNAKNAPQGAAAANAKNAPNTGAPGAQPAKPAKPSRPPRGSQNKAAAAAAKDAARTDTPTILSAPSTQPNASTSGTSAPASVAAPAAGAAGGGRRTRPVVGLASRQFEAALSGVSGLANAATERKRRERERDTQGAAANGGGGTPVPPTPTTAGSFARIDGSDTERPPPPAKAHVPPSPRKEKARRGGRGGAAGGGGGGAPPSTPQVKVPSILQRAPEPAQKDAPAASATAAPNGEGSVPPAEGSASGGGAGRGGRRGRGGGRGRGGAVANAPRGG